MSCQELVVVLAAFARWRVLPAAPGLRGTLRAWLMRRRCAWGREANLISDEDLPLLASSLYCELSPAGRQAVGG